LLQHAPSHLLFYSSQLAGTFGILNGTLRRVSKKSTRSARTKESTKC